MGEPPRQSCQNLSSPKILSGGIRVVRQPSVRRVGVLGHTTNPVFAKAMLDEVLLAGGPTGIEIKPVVMISGIDELDNAVSNLVSEWADAVVIQGSLAIKPV